MNVLPSLIPLASFVSELFCKMCAVASWLGDGRNVVESTKLPTKLSTLESDSCFMAIIVPAWFAPVDVFVPLSVDVPCNVTSFNCWSETVVRRAKRISDSEIVRWCDGDVLLSANFFFLIFFFGWIFANIFFF